MTKMLPPPPSYSPSSQAANDAKSDLQALDAPCPPSPPCEVNVAPIAGAHPDVSTVPARLEGRDARGRFAAGNSGRPKGARSRLITELEHAMELAAPEIVRILIGRAQSGDGSMDAAKYILERVAPSRRGRLVEIENFPDICTPADVPAALASLASAVGNGTITVEEGMAVGQLVQRFLETYESAHRLGKTQSD